MEGGSARFAFVGLLLASGLLGSFSTPARAQIPFAQPEAGNFTDSDRFQLALNLEYLEAEFYLHSAYGVGLESFNESLTGGGPPSVGGRRAALSPDILWVAQMLGLQETGHVRVIREYLGANAIPRPAINISVAVWTALIRAGLNVSLPSGQLDPYSGDITWLLAAYALPYVGLTAYVGANLALVARDSKALLGGVLGVEGGQDALLRTILWLRRDEPVPGYPGLTIQVATGAISDARDSLDGSGRDEDENIEVPPALGAENATTTNILAGNEASLSFARNAQETIRIIYGSGNASVPGGFYPKGVLGTIGDFYHSNADVLP